MATSGGKRFAGSITLAVQALGARLAKVDISKLTAVVGQFMDASRASNVQSRLLDSSFADMASGAHGLFPAIRAVSGVMHEYQAQLEQIQIGKGKLSDLSGKEIEDLDQIWKAYVRLTKEIKSAQAKGHTLLEPHMMKEWEKRGAALQNAVHQTHRLQMGVKVLSAATDMYGSVFKGVFSALIPQGAQDADIVFGIFKDSFSIHMGAIDKMMQAVGKDTLGGTLKKKGAEWLMGKMGLLNPAATTADIIKGSKDILKGVTGLADGSEGSPEAVVQKTAKCDDGIDKCNEKLGAFKDGLADAAKNPGKLGKNMADMGKKIAKGGEGLKKGGKAAKLFARGMDVVVPAAKGMAGSVAKTGSATGMMGTLAAAAGVSVATLNVVLIALAVAVLGAYIYIKLLAQGIKKFIKVEEEFRTAGFRAAGSIHELVGASMKLSRQTGLDTAGMVKLNKAMLAAGITGETLTKGVRNQHGELVTGTEALIALSVSAAKYTTATGASVEVTAKFTKHLIRMGASIEKNAQLLGQFTQAAKKFGLTAGDLDVVMGQLNKDMFVLQNNFGMGPDAIAEYTQQLGAMSGTAKRLGIDMSVVATIMQDIHSLNDRAMILGAFGGDQQTMMTGTAVEKMKVAIKGALGIQKMLNTMGHKARIEALASNQMTEEYLALLVERSKMTDEQLTKEARLDQARSDLDKSFEESTKTLSKLFERILTPILAIFTMIVEPIILGIEKMMAAFKDAGDETSIFGDLMENVGGLAGDVIDLFMILYAAVQPMFEHLWMGVKVFAGGLNLLVGVVRIIIKAFQILAMIGAVLISPLMALFNFINLIGNSVAELFSFLGNVFGMLFDWTATADEETKGMTKAWDKFTEAISKIWSPLATGMGWLRMFFGYLIDIYNFIFVGHSPSLIEVIEMIFMPVIFLGKIAGKVLNFVGDCFGGLYDSVMFVGKAIVDFLLNPWDTIMGLFDRALAHIKRFAKEAYQTLKDVPGLGWRLEVGEAVFGAGRKAGEAMSFEHGGGVEGDGPIYAHEGEYVIDKALTTQLSKYFGEDKLAADYAPIYTVQFTDDAKSQGQDKLEEVSDQLREISTLMNKLIDKDDPDTTRAADALEKIARDMDNAGNETQLPRRASGIGEKAVQWGLYR